MGLVKDPVQNPTESRFGFFEDFDDGHLKIYLKLDEADNHKTPNSAVSKYHSRYFSFNTPVEKCMFEGELHIRPEDLEDCLRNLGASDAEIKKIVDDFKEDDTNKSKQEDETDKYKENVIKLDIDIAILKSDFNQTAIGDQPLTERNNDYIKNKLNANRLSIKKYQEYDPKESSDIRKKVNDDKKL